MQVNLNLHNNISCTFAFLYSIYKKRSFFRKETKVEKGVKFMLSFTVNEYYDLIKEGFKFLSKLVQK